MQVELSPLDTGYLLKITWYDGALSAERVELSKHPDIASVQAEIEARSSQRVIEARQKVLDGVP